MGMRPTVSKARPGSPASERRAALRRRRESRSGPSAFQAASSQRAAERTGEDPSAGLRVTGAGAPGMREAAAGKAGTGAEGADGAAGEAGAGAPGRRVAAAGKTGAEGAAGRAGRLFTVKRKTDAEKKRSFLSVCISVPDYRHAERAAVDVTDIEYAEDRGEADGTPVPDAEFGPGFGCHGAEGAYDEEGGETAGKVSRVDFARTGDDRRHGARDEGAFRFDVGLRVAPPGVEEKLRRGGVGAAFGHGGKAVFRCREVVDLVGEEAAEVLQGVGRSEEAGGEEESGGVFVQPGGRRWG